MTHHLHSYVNGVCNPIEYHVGKVAPICQPMSRGLGMTRKSLRANRMMKGGGGWGNLVVVLVREQIQPSSIIPKSIILRTFLSITFRWALQICERGVIDRSVLKVIEIKNRCDILLEDEKLIHSFFPTIFFALYEKFWREPIKFFFQLEIWCLMFEKIKRKAKQVSKTEFI